MLSESVEDVLQPQRTQWTQSQLCVSSLRMWVLRGPALYSPHTNVARAAADSPRTQLTTFMARYHPDIVKLARSALLIMRKRLPGTVEMVYDNYNALVIGFSPNERPSDAIFSIALYPRWVNVFFLQGATELADPERLLRGSGSRVRSIRLTSSQDLDTPAVRALMAQAIARADPPIDPKGRRKLVIRAVSAKQRPRR